MICSQIYTCDEVAFSLAPFSLNFDTNRGHCGPWPVLTRPGRTTELNVGIAVGSSVPMTSLYETNLCYGTTLE